MGKSRQGSNDNSPKMTQPLGLKTQVIHVQESKQDAKPEEGKEEAKLENLEDPLDHPPSACEPAPVQSTLQILWATLPNSNPKIFGPYESSSESENTLKKKMKTKKAETPLPPRLQTYIDTTDTTTPTSLLSPCSTSHKSQNEEDESAQNNVCGGCRIS